MYSCHYPCAKTTMHICLYVVVRIYEPIAFCVTLISPQVGAGGRQSELSSNKSSALGSPRLHRPTSSYGRGGAIRLTTGGGQMVQHHIM